MSDVFNDNRFSILNEWSKPVYVYQHCWQSEVTHILKSRILNGWVNNDPCINILDKVESIITQNSIILNELEDYMHK